VSLDLGSLDSGKRYFWRVSSLQPSKLPVWSEAYSFISPVRVAAAAPVLVSPADKAEVADEFSLTWEASADDVEGYTVEIASDDSFSDILRTIKVAENTTTVRLVSSVLGIGTYYWRVVAEGSHYLPGVSAVYQFSVTHLDVGNFEPGYIVKTDDALYADAGKYKFENVWYRTVGNSNFSPEGNGSNNRGIAIAGDYVYMSGRKEASSKSDIYLKQYSLASGEHIRDINLSARPTPTRQQSFGRREGGVSGRVTMFFPTPAAICLSPTLSLMLQLRLWCCIGLILKPASLPA